MTTKIIYFFNTLLNPFEEALFGSNAMKKDTGEESLGETSALHHLIKLIQLYGHAGF